MKRLSIVSILLVVALLFCSCGGNTNTVSTDGTSSASDAPQDASSEDTSSVSDTLQNTSSEDPFSKQNTNLTKEYTVVQKTAAEKENMKRVKILIMGDSYTSGDGTASAYRHALFKTLYENGGHFQFVGNTTSSDVRLSKAYQDHLAKGGRTALQLLSLYENTIKGGRRDYDIALILIGGNDYYAGLPAADLFTRFKNLADTMIADRPDAYIFFSEMCEYGNVDKKKIDDVNAMLKTMIEQYKAEGKKIEYVDLDEYVTFTAEDDLMNVPPSGAHPNNTGNNKLGYAYGMAMTDTVLELNKLPADEDQLPFVDPTGVKASKTEMTLKIKEQGSLYYTISPSNSDVRSAIWSSSDPSVATVNEYGIVTALKAGEAVLTARVVGTNLKAEVKVTVTDETFKLTKAGAEKIYDEKFNDVSNWSGSTSQIKNGRVGKYYIDSVDLTSKESYTVSKDAGSISFYMIASGHLGKSLESYNAVSVGAYELRVCQNMQTILLRCDKKVIAKYTGDPYTFPGDKYTINFVDGKVSVYRNNECLMTADAPCDASGTVNIKSTANGTFLLDDLVLRSGK